MSELSRLTVSGVTEIEGAYTAEQFARYLKQIYPATRLRVLEIQNINYQAHLARISLSEGQWFELPIAALPCVSVPISITLFPWKTSESFPTQCTKDATLRFGYRSSEEEETHWVTSEKKVEGFDAEVSFALTDDGDVPRGARWVVRISSADIRSDCYFLIVLQVRPTMVGDE